MARRFRYYGKKRGHRRTGSPTFASMSEAVFSGVLLLLGICGLIWMIGEYIIPEWRVNHEFAETTCQVLAKQVGEKYFPDEGVLYRPEVRIRYEVGGDVYKDAHYDISYCDKREGYTAGRENAQAILDALDFEPGVEKSYACWYDPLNPRIAVLVRGYRWVRWLVFTIPLSFIIIGAGGLLHSLLHWGTSAERRAMIAQLAGMHGRSLFGANGGEAYPAVPQGADMTNSPGTKLKFRLPMSTSPGWTLFGTLAFCIVWNGIVAAFIAMAIHGYVKADRDWHWTLLSTVPFAAIGIWAIVVLVRQLLVTTGIGPTLVEISDHPLMPGGRYRVFVSQSGWLTVKSLRVSLVCEEIATYRQGTDARTESKEVHRQQLFLHSDFEIRGGMPFECEIDLNMPDNAMHSFTADHNEIAWKLVIEGDVAGWPAFKRAFPIIVRPAAGEPNQ